MVLTSLTNTTFFICFFFGLYLQRVFLNPLKNYKPLSRYHLKFLKHTVVLSADRSNSSCLIFPQPRLKLKLYTTMSHTSHNHNLLFSVIPLKAYSCFSSSCFYMPYFFSDTFACFLISRNFANPSVTPP